MLKFNSIFIYKYRSIFRVWKKPFENCNTVTLKQRDADDILGFRKKILGIYSKTAMGLLYLCNVNMRR